MSRFLLLSTAMLILWLSVTTAYKCKPACEHGDCVAYLGELSCQCFGNWSGDACEHFICDTANPCSNNGVCTMNPADSSKYMCVCPLGYTGNRCQYKYPGATSNCTNNPCGKHGTCYDTSETPIKYYPEGYYCDCNPNFYGPSCNYTTDPCIGKDCSGNGFCSVIPDYFGDAYGYCTCKSELWVSTELEQCFFRLLDYCLPSINPCQNGAVCELLDFPAINYTCTCPPDKQGRNCDEPLDICRNNSRCFNRGTCNPEGHYFTCTCPPNYTGEKCELVIDPCYNKSCLNGGSCIVVGNQDQTGYYDTTTNGGTDSYCECVCGYSGDQCQNAHFNLTSTTINPCTPNPCRENGVCVSDNTTTGFSCVCLDGFTGPSCDQIDHCANSSCNSSSSHSLQCVNGLNTFHCHCEEGWGGERCDLDIDECSGSPCSGATCTNVPGSYICKPNCSDIECENGGVCIQKFDGPPMCFCIAGFTGDRCQMKMCS